MLVLSRFQNILNKYCLFNDNAVRVILPNELFKDIIKILRLRPTHKIYPVTLHDNIFRSFHVFDDKYIVPGFPVKFYINTITKVPVIIQSGKAAFSILAPVRNYEIDRTD